MAPAAGDAPIADAPRAGLPAARAGGRQQNIALVAIALLTGWRVAMLWFNQAELWVDEAQYWLWGQSFSFGAFSKPPLIGWLIGLVTWLAGDSTFGVRLAAPLIHGVTAVLVMKLAARLENDRAAVLAGLSYVTMPAATLGALLISTDTPMLLAIACALLAQHRLAKRPSAGFAVLLGMAVGLGLLSKHSMLFAVAGMAVAAALSPAWRPVRRDLAVALTVSLLMVAPNLWWIARHGFVTLHHLADAGGVGQPGIHPLRAVFFLGEQFAVMGPLAFAAFVLSGRGAPGPLRAVWAMAAMILVIVTMQALSGRALANWAVGFTVPGSIVAAVWLDDHPRLAAGSLGLGLVLAIALPVLTVAGTGWRLPDGELMLARYLGRAEVSARAMEFARQNGAAIIAADDRGLLAGLSWQARGSDLQIMAAPHQGPPRHHWDLLSPPGPEKAGPVVLLRIGAPPEACASGPRESWIAGPGFAEGAQLTLTLTSSACLMDASHD